MAAVLRSGRQWAGRPGFSPGRRPNAAAIAAAPGPLAGDPAAPRFPLRYVTGSSTAPSCAPTTGSTSTPSTPSSADRTVRPAALWGGWAGEMHEDPQGDVLLAGGSRFSLKPGATLGPRTGSSGPRIKSGSARRALPAVGPARRRRARVVQIPEKTFSPSARGKDGQVTNGAVVGHCCFITAGAGGLISRRWCTTVFAPVLRRLPTDLTEDAILRPELLLFQDGPVEIYFVPSMRHDHEPRSWSSV